MLLDLAESELNDFFEGGGDVEEGIGFLDFSPGSGVLERADVFNVPGFESSKSLLND